MKYQCFLEELEMIKNNKIREDCKTLINLLPDYFFLIPAASSGKYHPACSLGEKGLIRHTKLAVRIAYDLLSLEFNQAFTDNEKDLIIMALIIHDGIKSGIPKEEYTRVDHPLLIGNFITENKNNLSISDEDMNQLVGMVKSHMGEWNQDRNGNEVLPKPQTKCERFVHMCDYLSSRQYLDAKFDEYNNLIVNRSIYGKI